VKLHWYRLLDSLQSCYRRKTKEIRESRKWGPDWRNMVRSGRRYSRTFLDDVDLSADPTRGLGWKLHPEPGWELNCSNCHGYSFITESMMPEIIAAWAMDIKRMANHARATGKRIPPAPLKPTAATAGCLHCKCLPGAPE